MKSLALIIPKGVIPAHRNRGDVFEVSISRVSRPAKKYLVYMTHKPGYKKAYLPIRHVGAKKGEEFIVRPPEKYEIDHLARDYNATKPKGLENTSLDWKDGNLVLTVGGSEIQLKEVVLRVQEGKAVLDLKLNDENKNAAKIAKGTGGFDFRFVRDHAIVTSMSENRDGITVTYQRTQNDIPPHARLIEKVQTEGRELEGWKHEFDIQRNGVWMQRGIGLRRDEISVSFSNENRIAAATYWASHEEHAEKWHQGDIGEEVAAAILEKSNFKTTEEHTNPITGRVPVHKSEHGGMDRVVEREGKYYVVQVKHWLEPQKALEKAKYDLIVFKETSDRRTLERDLGSKIEGGLVIQVHWSYQNQEAVIYTDYIEF